MKSWSLCLIGMLVWVGFATGSPSGQLSNEQKNKNTASVSGLGKISFPTSGSPEAQPWFLRGVLLLHNFQYDDAKEAFRKSQEIHPGFAMAYWGEAMTENHTMWIEQDAEEARAILNRLGPTTETRLAKAPTQREKMYVRAIETLYGPGDKQSRDEAYAEAMRQLAETFPQDLEAKAFYSLAILGTAQGERNFRTYMKAAAIAEEVFQKNRQHPGAVHYLIHSYDDPIHAPLGLRPARIYAAVAPAASHAQHMPSHIFMALGMWDEVVRANEASWAASEARRKQVGSGSDTPPFHALHWLEYAYLQQGRFDDAKGLVKFVEKKTRETPSGYARGYAAAMRATYIIETRQWNVGHIQEDRKGLRLPAAASDLFAIGMSAVRMKKLDTAHRASAQLKTYLGPTPEVSANAHMAAVKVMDLQLEGLILVEEEKKEKGLQMLYQAAAKEDERPYDYGPPVPVKPSHELLGEILLHMDRPEEAKKEFEASLERIPNRSLSTIGLKQAMSTISDYGVSK